MSNRLLLLAAALCLTACGATTQVNRFRAFAELGRSYEGAVLKVVDQAAAANIDASSQELVEARRLNADRNTRVSQVERYDAEVVETTRVYMRLKRQIGLLSDYFTALGALASYDGDSAIGTSTSNLITALNQVSGQLSSSPLLSDGVPEAVGGVAALVVTGIRARRLREELERNGEVIQRHLLLQERLLTALAEDITEDQQWLSDIRLRDQLHLPYAAADPLPSDWTTRRRELLLARAAAAAPAEEAAALSRRLRLAFVALAEGRMEAGDLETYANDLGRLLTLIEAASGSSS